MREIKFRFFDGGKMCEVGDLTFFADNAGYHINGEFPSTGKDLYPLMQFTGLLDKNGKEIYEGDVLKASNREIGQCVFNNGSFKWMQGGAHWQLVDWNKDDATKVTDVEVIGNIYENPELLK